MAPKVKEISELLIKRIQNGDYAINQLPSGRRLASELGVSYLTARRAVEHVVGEGWLERNSTGRIEIGKRPQRMAKIRVAFVSPAFVSTAIFFWLRALRDVVEQRGGMVRNISYGHWDDPIIFDALTSDFDGIFIVPPIDMPKIMMAKLAKYSDRLVTLFHDLTEYGIPMLDGQSPADIDMLVDHLYKLGHHHIDCMNTQPKNQIIDERIEQWWKSLSARGIEGTLHNAPVKPFENTGVRARVLLDQLLTSHHFNATALFCTTVECAHGAMRALHDKGLRAGPDVSVCSFAENEAASLMIPSLTVIKDSDPRPNILRALEWIFSRDKDLEGPMIIRSETSGLQIGESTQPVLKSKKS